MQKPEANIRETLYRIALLLFSLAALAERSASVSPALRRIVLFVLRQGEFAALELLFDRLTNGRAFPSFDDYWNAVESDEPGEAMLLAARLRLFAFAVATLAMRVGAGDGIDPARSACRGDFSGGSCNAGYGGRGPVYVDTS